MKNFFTGRLFPTLLLLLFVGAAFVCAALFLPVLLAPLAAAERLFSFCVGISVLSENTLPESKTARLTIVLLLPWTGAIVCLCTRRKQTANEAVAPFNARAESAEYFGDGAIAGARMIQDFKNARKSIWLEYYIISQGEFWQSILAVLREKAKEGVDVRVVYDDFGCGLTLPRRYPETLARYGIECRVFRPVTLSRRADLRDHRKIAVIDGEIAYTGGMNLADEYVGKLIRFGHWKDAAVRVTGEAARAFGQLFLQNFEKKQPDDARNPDTGIACTVFADGADRAPRTGVNCVIGLARAAKTRLWLTTPYLLPDSELLYALKAASRSGVQVRIAVPHVPDKKTVFLLTRYYARKLIKQGVEVREYDAGFLHAKNIVSDDIAAVSSYNLDFRSMRLQAECGIIVEDEAFCKNVAEDFALVWATSSPPPEQTKRESFYIAFLKLFSPLV